MMGPLAPSRCAPPRAPTGEVGSDGGGGEVGGGGEGGGAGRGAEGTSGEVGDEATMDDVFIGVGASDALYAHARY